MIAVSLFDYTGAMLRPWADAGYECYAYDIQHTECFELDGINYRPADLTTWVKGDLPRADVAFAFPPCDHLAVSGARWFKGKGLRALSHSIALFATAAEYCEWTRAPYMIENPVSTIATYWREPDYYFHPWEYTEFCLEDNYTKRTCLWTGNDFVMPDPAIAESLRDVKPDNRIHAAPPGPGRANFRSATPRGFAQAVFNANKETKSNV